MGVIFDAVSSGQSIGLPLTIPHTIAAGDEPGLVSAIFVKREDSPGVVTAVAFDGAPMTKHGELDESGVFRLYLYKLAAPMQGAPGNVVISGTALDFASAINVSAFGVDQANVLGATVTGRGDSALSSLLTVVDALVGGLLIDNHFVLGSNDPAPLVNQTERGEEIFASIGGRQNLSTKNGADGGAMGWSWASPATWFAMAVAIKAAAEQPRQAISLARQKTVAISLKAGSFS